MRSTSLLLFLSTATASGCANVIVDEESVHDAGPPCSGPHSFVVDGSIEGAATHVEESFEVGLFSSGGVGLMSSGTGQALLLTARSQFPCGAKAWVPNCPGALGWGGTSPSAVAMVQLAPESGTPVTWVCDPSGPEVTFTPALPAGHPFEIAASSTLASLHALGTCPGMPVDAKLSIVAGSTLVDPMLTGTIDGQSFQSKWNTRGFGGAGPKGWLTEFFEGGGAVLLLDDGTALAVLPEASPDPGAVYCIGNSSTLADGSIVYEDLSRLGRCSDAPTIAGSLSVCASGN